MARFAVIDVANLFFRCQFATKGDAFTKAGMALHIVFRSLRKLHREMAVDHMVFCVEGKSWRYAIYPQYKAKRKLDRLAKPAKEKEEDEVFLETLDQFTNYLAEKTRCTVLQSQGVEGDDFVARFIQNHPDDDHIILSGDSDFVQLLAPNVRIYDAVQERILSVDGVRNLKGEEMVFHINPSDGKIKVTGTIAEAKAKHDKEQKAKAKLIGSEIVPFEFTPEPDWHKKALFVKCVRGDTGDGIFSAFPGVRYAGSSKKTGIREAWEDRNAGGYNWNNFMLQRWQKLLGTDGDGNKIVKEVLVLDEFKFNESLIDLTKQPDEIKQLMDVVIAQAVEKEPVGNVGIHFMRFCAQNSLPNLSKEATDHAAYLNAAYPKTPNV
jgi:hypothetical protein